MKKYSFSTNSGLSAGGDFFVAEIYFVSTREFTQVKFGGPIGDARDPETGLAIGTMVYGDFALRVSERIGKTKRGFRTWASMRT